MNKQAWKPNSEIAKRGCRFVYVPDASVYVHDNSCDACVDYDDFKCCVEDALPSSFKMLGTLREDAVVVAQNGHFEVCLTRAPDWATVLVVMVREDAPAFARARLGYVADAIFRKVAERYELMAMSGKRVIKWRAE
jgi:hypothetical protein